MEFLRMIFTFSLSLIFPVRFKYRSLDIKERTDSSSMPLAKPRASTPGQPDYTQEPQRRAHVSSKVRDASRRVSKIFTEGSISGLRLPWSKDGRRTEDTSKLRVERGRRSLPPISENQTLNEPIRVRRDVDRTRDDPSRRLFHDKLDLCAETEIVNDCDALNDKINNAALSLIDEWSKAPTLSNKRRFTGTGYAMPLSSNDQEYLTSVVGAKVFTLITNLRSSSPSDDLQNRMTDALQALAVYVSFRTISQTFCPGLSYNANVEMQHTFEHMLAQEPQATALRWRALTFEHSSRDTTVEAFTAGQNADLAYLFSRIFILAGERDASRFLSTMRHNIAEHEIVESALQLAKKIKTSFFSVHLDAFIVQPGSVFRVDAMERLDGDAKRETYERRSVSYTLELGIREIPYAAQERTGRILLKPKVVLEE